MAKAIGNAMRGVFIAGALITCASPVNAHHGWSGYDSSRVLELKGKIVESGYEHPHGFVRLETEGKTWLVVLARHPEWSAGICRASSCLPAQKQR